MELIRGNVVLKFNEEEIKALNRAIKMLEQVKDTYDKLDYEDYDMEELGEYYVSFSESSIYDLKAFSDYIKENSYSITMYK